MSEPLSEETLRQQQEAAQAVGAAADAFNDAVNAASRLGLQVQADILEKNSMFVNMPLLDCAVVLPISTQRNR